MYRGIFVKLKGTTMLSIGEVDNIILGFTGNIQLLVERKRLMNCFFEWLDQNKEKDLIRIQICKIIYSIEIVTIPHVTMSAVMGIIIPILWEKVLWIAIVLLVLFISENSVFCICEKYHVKAFEDRKFAASILADQSALLNSIGIMINDTPSWRAEIFKKTCDMVCAKLHEEFKNVYKCDVRVSIEYTFEKEVNGVKDICRKMAGRCSGDRIQTKKACRLSQRDKYYSYKIFKDNIIGIHYLNREDISNGDKWYKNPNHNVEVIQYVALANSFNEQEVSFILQIDCLDSFVFGKNNTDKEVKKFANEYLKPYVNIIGIGYLLGRNKKGIVGEV